MKVAYFISVHDKPYGGHYHSLKTHVESLPDGISASIFVIGFVNSPIFDELDVQFIHFNGSNVFSTLKSLCKLVSDDSYDIYHAYDEHAYLFVRLLSLIHPAIKFITKCGGPNPSRYFKYGPRRYFPCCANLIVFSRENYQFFKKKHYADVLKLISARVSPFDLNPDVASKLEGVISSHEIIFLRVTRICHYYKKTILDSIKMVLQLREDGVKCKLLVVGEIYDKELYQELIEDYSEGLQIITDKNLTLDAKQCIQIADFVIGTGRSLMEAMCLSKPVLAPVSNGNIPHLISEKNLDEFVTYNFSERTLTSNSDENSYRELLEVCSSLTSYKRVSIETKKIFDRNFDVSIGTKQVVELYMENLEGKSSDFSFDLIVHFIRVLVLFLKRKRRMGDVVIGVRNV